MKDIKNIIIGFSIGLLSVGAYAQASNGTIGALFKDLGGGNGWVLMGDNIEDGTVDSSEIEDKSLTTSDILDNTLTYNDIADATIRNEELANNAVNSAKVQDNTLTYNDIADGTIRNEELANNAVNSAKIQDGTITTSDILDNTLTYNDIADGTIRNEELANNAVNSAKVQDNTLTYNDIADGTIRNQELANDSVNSAKIADNSITAADLAADSVGNSELVNDITLTKLRVSEICDETGQNCVDVSEGLGGGGETECTYIGSPCKGGLYLGNNIVVQSSDLGSYTWTNAVNACNNSAVGGQTDWYLPNQSELNTLYGQKNTIGAFSAGRFWSSTEYSSGSAHAREQDFNNGTQGYAFKANSYYVRCFRKF